MSDVQTVRIFVQQRLTTAAEEIFELFQKTVAEYEERLCRQKKLLEAVSRPDVRLHAADVQQLLVCKDEELWTNQEGEQLQWLEEAHITTFTVVPVKSEDNEEKPQSLQLHPTEQMKTEGEDCGPELGGTSDPDQHLQPDRTENSSEPQSGVNSLKHDELSVNDREFNTEPTAGRSSGWVENFGCKEQNGVQSKVKPFSCSVCGKRYRRKDSLMTHMRLHSEGKRFSCLVCKKTFQWRAEVERHMRVHTGEKPFGCSVCGTRFAVRSNLAKHAIIHTRENPVTCSVCKKSFSHKRNLAQHMRKHNRKKTSGSVCGIRSGQKTRVAHLVVHTGDQS